MTDMRRHESSIDFFEFGDYGSGTKWRDDVLKA